MSNITRRGFLTAIGALAGATAAAQFERQLGAMARTLSGPQEWILSFDEPGLERLFWKRMSIESTRYEGGRAVAECSLDVSESDLWALATLTDPDGAEWRTVDGETWEQGERKMIL